MPLSGNFYPFQGIFSRPVVCRSFARTHRETAVLKNGLIGGKMEREREDGQTERKGRAKGQDFIVLASKQLGNLNIHGIILV